MLCDIVKIILLFFFAHLCMSDNQCPICLSFMAGDKKVLCCNHVFHNDCITKALEESPRCPVCRTIEKESLEKLFEELVTQAGQLSTENDLVILYARLARLPKEVIDSVFCEIRHREARHVAYQRQCTMVLYAVFYLIYVSVIAIVILYLDV